MYYSVWVHGKKVRLHFCYKNEYYSIGMRTVWVKQGFGGPASLEREAEAADMVIYSIGEASFDDFGA